MNKEQRYRALDVTLLMHVVDVQYTETLDFDVASELWELGVQSCFLGSPVEAVFPPSDETLYILQRRAIFRSRVFEFIWKCDQRKPLLKELELLVRDGYFEGRFGWCH